MKYLKYFESISKCEETRLVIENLVKDNIPYILDEGFKFSVETIDNGEYYYLINIFKEDDNFKWSSIKEDMLQFLDLIKLKYTPVDFYATYSSFNVYDLLTDVGIKSEEEIDRLLLDTPLSQIILEIRNKE